MGAPGDRPECRRFVALFRRYTERRQLGRETTRAQARFSSRTSCPFAERQAALRFHQPRPNDAPAPAPCGAAGWHATARPAAAPAHPCRRFSCPRSSVFLFTRHTGQIAQKCADGKREGRDAKSLKGIAPRLRFPHPGRNRRHGREKHDRRACACGKAMAIAGRLQQVSGFRHTSIANGTRQALREPAGRTGCRSSGVEHSLGKGEVESSNLSGSTSFKHVSPKIQCSAQTS